jgi:microcystin-dependent protein
MSKPYIGEIRMFAGIRAPQGWALCDGSDMSMSQHDSLYALIGTTYGGDMDKATFKLPDLRGRIPISMNSAYPLGANVGSEVVTLDSEELPTHRHGFSATNSPATTGSPINAVPANTSASGAFLYFADRPRAAMSEQSLAIAGGNQPHNNLQPFLCVNFIIAIDGHTPSQN